MSPAIDDAKIAAYCKREGYERTGVFASEAQAARARELMREVSETPVIKVHGVWLHESADESAREKINTMALECGLPKLAPTPDGPEFYGILANREFVTRKLDITPAKATGEKP